MVGPGHPSITRNACGSPNCVPAHRRDNLHSFHSSHFAPDKERHDGVVTEHDNKLTIEGQFTDILTRQVDKDIRLRESGWGLDGDVWIGCAKTGPKCVLLNSQGHY